MKFLPTWIGVRNTFCQMLLLGFLGFVIWDIPNSIGWQAALKGFFILLALALIFAAEAEKWEEG